jgi:glycosyltransferase involved in cell wall biosynthesis
MGSLRILHTESSTGWGGQEIRILTEAQGMQQRGHQVALLCPPDATIFRAAMERGIEVTGLPIGRKRVRGLLALRAWLKDHPVSVINTHSSTDSWLAALAGTTLHSPPPLVRTRHVSAPISNNASTRWLYTKATLHIVTTGEALRRQLIDANGYELARITSIPTGINLDRFVPPADRRRVREQLALPPAAPLVGVVATLRDWKGHRYLVDAFARINAPDARLLIVGDGPEWGRIKQQIECLGIGPKVLMPGNQEDVTPWFQVMDIFVLPSYANEGVPQALLQAMACGLPVVTTPVGGILEAVTDNETGLIVEPGQVEPLSRAMERLLNDLALRVRLGGAARCKAMQNFGIAAMLDKMERVFYDAAGHR